MTDLYPARARIPKGLRRVLVLLPIRMVVDLDARIAGSNQNLSRSKVVAFAVRRLLDEGGVEDISADLDWSDLGYLLREAERLQADERCCCVRSAQASSGSRWSSPPWSIRLLTASAMTLDRLR